MTTKPAKSPAKVRNPLLAKRMKDAMALDGEKHTQQWIVEEVRRLMEPLEPGEEFKLSQANLSKLCRGEVERSDWTPHVAKALNVDAFWLATGRGEARQPSTTGLTPKQIGIAKSLGSIRSDVAISIEMMINTLAVALNPAMMAKMAEDLQNGHATQKKRIEADPNSRAAARKTVKAKG